LDFSNSQLIFSLVSIFFLILLAKTTRYRWLLVTFNILLGTRYLAWRALYTLNHSSSVGLTLSIILFLAEAYGFIQIGLFFVQSSFATNPIPPPLASDERLPTVDIFIPIYNEPEEIIYRTIVGCQAQDYPAEKKEVYVLDDGRRKEIKQLAEKLGCHYLTRPDNKYAKAGNLNNGLKYSHGEIIAFFDCDQVPVGSFLKETIAFFQDPEVGFLQTPQHFYNQEFFQRNLKKQEIGHEQDLFFHVAQPGRDYFNSAFFCGSGGLCRRSALEAIGGFTQYADIEDLPTSIELHAKGYKSVYLDKDLCAGISPESCSGYINQRKRWTRAAMQVFILNNPIFKKGLTFAQKISYFYTLYYFFLGFPRIVIVAWPLTYLLIDIPPIISPIVPILHYFTAYQVSVTITMDCFTKRHRNFFFNDVYETVVSFPVAAAALSALLLPKKQQVTVTPKGERFEKSQITPSLYPHIVLFCLLLLGVGRGLYKINLGGFNDSGLIICSFWGAYNVLVLLIAILSAREQPQKRNSFRIDKQIKAELILPDKVVSCFTKEISDTGCCVMLTKAEILPESEITLKLIGSSAEINDLQGRITRYDREGKKAFNLGIEFTNIDEATRQKIIRLIYSPADSWQEDHLHEKSIWSSFSTFFSSPQILFVKDRILRRFTPRFNITLPCEIALPDKTITGRTKNISVTGLSLQVIGELKLPEEIDIKLMRQDKIARVRGKVIGNTFKGKETSIGVKFLEPYRGRDLWEELGY